MKRFVFAGLLLLIGISGSISIIAVACSFHQQYANSFNLVDSGRKVDWGGYTRYSSEWDYAVGEWNKEGKVKIQPDTLPTLEDVAIEDYYEDSAIIAAAYPNGRVELNTAQLDTMTSSQKKHTMLRILGYVMGIKEMSNVSGSVMQQGKLTLTLLGTPDKEIYHCLWP